MRRIATMLGMLALAVGLAAGPVGAAGMFADMANRFTFTIPDGVQQRDAPLPAVVVQYVADALSGASVNVVADRLPPDVTLDQYVSTSVANLGRALPAYEADKTSVQNTTLGGEPARRYDLYYTTQGIRLHAVQVVALKSGAAYVITFTALDRDFDTFYSQTRGVVDSFQFLAGASNLPALPPSPPGVALPATGYAHASAPWMIWSLLVGGECALVGGGMLLRRRGAAGSA